MTRYIRRVGPTLLDGENQQFHAPGDVVNHMVGQRENDCVRAYFEALAAFVGADLDFLRGRWSRDRPRLQHAASGGSVAPASTT